MPEGARDSRRGLSLRSAACQVPLMAAPAAAAPPGEEAAPAAPEFEVAALQEQMQRQIEQYEDEVLSSFAHVDSTALRQSVKALEAGNEEAELDIDEQEVQRRDAAAKRKQKRRVLFGPDVDELYGNSTFLSPPRGRRSRLAHSARRGRRSR